MIGRTATGVASETVSAINITASEVLSLYNGTGTVLVKSTENFAFKINLAFGPGAIVDLEMFYAQPQINF